VPGHERTRETLVAGSFMVIPKGQLHKVHCLEPGVVFVSYEGNPDITPIAEVGPGRGRGTDVNI